ncbi:MAG: YesL family protein [Oscillospiraceae bacterium]|nr:YesL family protein [Oscillospiraceae bacterium]
MKQQSKLKDSLLRFLRDLFDLTVLNWLWLVCSLPIVTVGPATCALYAVTLKMAREEPVSPVKDFFRGFRVNAKPGFLLGLAAAVLLAAAAGDLWLARQLTGNFRTLYLVVAVMVAVIFLIFLAYTFPLQAMFDSSVKTHIKNAFKLTVVAPVKTLFLWLILLIPVLFALVLPPVAVASLGFLYIIAGISGPVYGASYILRNLFDYVNGSPVVEIPPVSDN